MYMGGRGIEVGIKMARRHAMRRVADMHPGDPKFTRQRKDAMLI